MKEYNKKYTVSLKGALTSEGTAIPDMQTSFTTLVPNVIKTNPANGDITYLWDNIYVYFNAPMIKDTSKENINLTDQDGNIIPAKIIWLDRDIFCGGRCSIKIVPEELKPSSSYTVSLKGLKAEEGFALSDYSFQFSTPKRTLLWKSPTIGATNVPVNQHRVIADINDSLTGEEKAAVESAIVISSKTYEDSRPLSEDHPEPLFMWTKGEHNYDVLYINFTFDEGMNYKVWAKDLEGNPVEDIKDQSGNVILHLTGNLEFTTSYPASSLGKPYRNLVSGFFPKPPAGSEKVDNFLSVKPYVVFNTIVKNIKLKVYVDDIEVNLESIDLRTKWYNDGNYFDEYYVSYAYLNGLTLDYGKTYKVVVTEAEIDSESQDYEDNFNIIDNLPFTESFSTSGPRLIVYATNGEITINSHLEFDFEALKDAFTVTPTVSCNWQYWDNDDQYKTHVICAYDPIKYSNIKVEIGELKAYKENGTKMAGIFENTPFSQILMQH